MYSLWCSRRSSLVRLWRYVPRPHTAQIRQLILSRYRIRQSTKKILFRYRSLRQADYSDSLDVFTLRYLLKQLKNDQDLGVWLEVCWSPHVFHHHTSISSQCLCNNLSLPVENRYFKSFLFLLLVHRAYLRLSTNNPNSITAAKPITASGATIEKTVKP